MIHKIKEFLCDHFHSAIDHVFENIDHIFDGISIGFFCTITFEKWCNLNIHDMFGDVTYYVVGTFTLLWVGFRALSSAFKAMAELEDYKMKKKARIFQEEVLDEASK